MMETPIPVEGTRLTKGGESKRRWRTLGGLGTAFGVCLLLFAEPAVATPIAFSIIGVVTFVSDSGGVLDDSVAVGAPFSGFVSFEPPGVPGLQTDTFREERFPAPPASIWVSIGSLFVAAGQPFAEPLLEITIANGGAGVRCPAPCDELRFAIPGPERVPLPTSPVRTSIFTFRDPTGQALSDLSLPTAPPDLNLFAGTLSVAESGVFAVGGRVDSAVLVPEPSSLLLSGAGLAVLLAARRLRVPRRPDRLASASNGVWRRGGFSAGLGRAGRAGGESRPRPRGDRRRRVGRGVPTAAASPPS